MEEGACDDCRTTASHWLELVVEVVRTRLLGLLDDVTYEFSLSRVLCGRTVLYAINNLISIEYPGCTTCCSARSLLGPIVARGISFGRTTCVCSQAQRAWSITVALNRFNYGLSFPRASTCLTLVLFLRHRSQARLTLVGSAPGRRAGPETSIEV